MSGRVLSWYPSLVILIVILKIISFPFPCMESDILKKEVQNRWSVKRLRHYVWVQYNGRGKFNDKIGVLYKTGKKLDKLPYSKNISAAAAWSTYCNFQKVLNWCSVGVKDRGERYRSVLACLEFALAAIGRCSEIRAVPSPCSAFRHLLCLLVPPTVSRSQLHHSDPSSSTALGTWTSKRE